MKPSYIKLLSIIVICCLGFIVYSGTFFYPFSFDDLPSLTTNIFIRNIAHLQNIWKFWPTRFVTYLSFALNYYFHQLNVLGYHIVNLAVHLGAAILLWQLTLLTFLTPAIRDQKIFRYAKLIAFFTGLIFVAHPIQTQGVTYIHQRAASLATLFYLAALSLYVKSRILGEQGGNRIVSRILYSFSLLIAVVAMFTKEITVTLPLMVCLYEFSFFRTKRGLNWKYLDPFLLTLLITPLTIVSTKLANHFAEVSCAIKASPGISSWHYLLTQFRVIVTYIRLFFLPLNQNLDYDYPKVVSLLNLPVLVSLFFLAGILFLAIRLFRNYRLVAFGIFWFFLTLLPESSIMAQVDVIFEHRLYLPMAGFSLFLVSGLYYLFKEKRIKFTVSVLCLLVIFYSVLAYQRNKVWKDSFTLWDDVVRKSPRKARPYLGRGIAYQSKGDFNRALIDYNKVIEINPNSVDAYNNRGNLYQIKGNFEQAFLDYNQAIKIDPCYAVGYNNRGTILVAKGNFNQAISDYTKVIALNGPNLVSSYNNRGVAYSIIGNHGQAALDYTKAIELDPNYAEAYSNRAKAYYFKREYTKAWGDVHKAEGLGFKFKPAFIDELKKSTGQLKNK